MLKIDSPTLSEDIALLKRVYRAETRPHPMFWILFVLASGALSFHFLKIAGLSINGDNLLFIALVIAVTTASVALPMLCVYYVRVPGSHTLVSERGIARLARRASVSLTKVLGQRLAATGRPFDLKALHDVLEHHQKAHEDGARQQRLREQLESFPHRARSTRESDENDAATNH
jgi:hypothetical protein